MKKIMLSFLLLPGVMQLNAGSDKDLQFEIVRLDKNNEEMKQQLCHMIDEDAEIRKQASVDSDEINRWSASSSFKYDIAVCKTKGKGENIIGFMIINPEEGKICNLAVHANYRGRQVAQKLLHEAQQIAEKHDNYEVRLDVYKDNHKAIGAYEKAGFALYNCAGSLCSMKKKIIVSQEKLAQRCTQFTALFNDARAQLQKNDDRFGRASRLIPLRQQDDFLGVDCMNLWLHTPENKDFTIGQFSAAPNLRYEKSFAFVTADVAARS